MTLSGIGNGDGGFTILDINGRTNLVSNEFIKTKCGGDIREAMKQLSAKSSAPESETSFEALARLIREQGGIQGNDGKLKPEKDYPLNPDGTLKSGYRYNPKTGEWKAPELNGPCIMRKEDLERLNKSLGLNLNLDGPTHIIGQVEDDDGFVDANGHKPGEAIILNYVPSRDDYEPVFEMKDGKLVQIGTKKKEKRYELY